jgi:hypothetical protein
MDRFSLLRSEGSKEAEIIPEEGFASSTGSRPSRAVFAASSASSSSSSRRHSLSVLAKRRSTGDADRSAVGCRRSPRPLDEVAPSIARPSWPVNAATRLREGGAAAAGLGYPSTSAPVRAPSTRTRRGCVASSTPPRPRVRSGTVAATATASGCSTSSRPPRRRRRADGKRAGDRLTCYADVRITGIRRTGALCGPIRDVDWRPPGKR